MAEEKSIWIITEEDVEGQRGLYGGYVNRSSLSAEKLKQNMGEFLEVIQEVFAQANKPIELGMQLDELELSVEINGKGQVSLLGTGGEAGAKGAIKLKFKRSNIARGLSNLVLDSDSRELIKNTLGTGTGTTLQVFNFETPTVNTSGKEIKRESHSAQYFTEDLGNGLNLDLILISGGKFLMGTENEEIERLVKKFDWDGYRSEKPQHEVTVQSFLMGKFPVTQAQWRAIASLPKVERDLKPNPSSFKGDDRPVESVNWYDAVEFCARLSQYTGREYRLPSEAEWEYACRAVTSYHSSLANEQLRINEWNEKYHQPFHFGETITTDLANYRGSDLELEGKTYPGTYADEPRGEYREETTPVGQFPPNAFGLYDMHGNVLEWCQDDWHDNYNNAPSDGSAWLDTEKSRLVVVRGGSWNYNPDNCRSAFRINFERDFFNNFGFRVVCVGGRNS